MIGADKIHLFFFERGEILFFFVCYLILGSTGGEITALTFDGCDAEEDDECEAARGSTVVGQMTFKVRPFK